MAAYLRELRRSRAPGTVRTTRVSLCHWLPQVLSDDAPITDLCRDVLAQIYDVSTGAEASRQKRVSHVYGFWAWLYDHESHGELLTERRHRPRRLDLPPIPSSPVRAPTWAQMDAVLAAVRSTLAWRTLLIQRYTGLRAGQVRGLLWPDFDLGAAELLVRGELGKSRQERQGRRIPVSPPLVEEIARWGRRDGNVVGGGRPNYEMYYAAWQEAGVPPELWRRRPTHAFRKGWITGLRALGADTEAVEYLVGHSLGLRGVYLDASALPLRETVARVPRVGTEWAHEICPILPDPSRSFPILPRAAGSAAEGE